MQTPPYRAVDKTIKNNLKPQACTASTDTVKSSTTSFSFIATKLSYKSIDINKKWNDY